MGSTLLSQKPNRVAESSYSSIPATIPTAKPASTLRSRIVIVVFVWSTFILCAGSPVRGLGEDRVFGVGISVL